MPASPVDPPPALRRVARARTAPLAVLVIVLALTAVAVVLTVRGLHSREADRRDRDADAAVQAVDRRLQAYTEILQGMAGFYESSRRVSPREFHRYIAGRRIAERFPGVEILGYAEQVPAADVEAFVIREQRAIRRSGLRYPPLLPIKGRPGAADALLVSRLESKTALSLGYDVYSEPKRRAAALLARNSGRPAATAPITLLIRGGDRRGFGLFAPVYRGAVLPPPPQERASRFRGVVFAAFRAAALLRGVLGPVGPAVDLEIRDGDALAFDLRPQAMPRDDPRARHALLVVGGRHWNLTYLDMASPLATTERAVPIIIAVGGTLLALLSAALLHSLTTSRERAIELAHGMTAELRARERELARSNEELEHFAYLASHDLQEPLRTIRSYTGLLERRLGDRLDAKERSWFGYITTGAGHMSELIADLLEYSRAGISRGDLEAVDLAEAWGDAERRLASAISESGAHVERAPLPVVAGRRGELVSLLQNLLANAIKYRRPGVAPVVKVEASRQRDVWEVRVTDNGIGIDPRFHDRVFGLFQRLHSSDEYPGTGMGLAIVRKLAEANGGAVHVESAAGGGTAVVVALRDWEATT